MSRDQSLDIAVTGISGRLPGVANLAEFWGAIKKGQTLIRRFSSAELQDLGVPSEIADSSSYVPAFGSITDSDRFDNDFFNISPREATILDPQQRLLLECAWGALEDAGHALGKDDALRTGVYGSVSSSSHLRALLRSGDIDVFDEDEMILANERDFLATRIAYKLGLRGPALTVLTACSSSLAAVHIAAQALNNGDCDQALVVAASVNGTLTGYPAIQGGVMSPSGECRPFDASADGTVSGAGVIGIVLRRLEDMKDRTNSVHGVILGSALNNDGAAKAGFLAPSATGQEGVIKAAVAAADIPADSIGYLESHGTGTFVGDPIEWSGAASAYRSLGVEPDSIAVGAVKGIIGHLDVAAGLAGLVKALLVVRHGFIPPIPGLRTPNPMLEQDGSPLHLPKELRPWSGPLPRRAAVSSFGVGGTNVHLIVEQAPVPAINSQSGPSDEGQDQVVALSAEDPMTLQRLQVGLADYLSSQPRDLSSVSSTMASRTAMRFRNTIVASDMGQLVEGLRSTSNTHGAASRRQSLFLFPGQGSQVPGMSLPLESVIPGVREAVDACLEKFSPEVAADVERALRDPDFPSDRLLQTSLAQPALFALEHATGSALIALGIVPTALAGHSLGEITAACLAGTLSLNDAAALVERRGLYMQDCEPGRMMVLACSEDETKALLGDRHPNVSIAASNTSTSTVIAGAPNEIYAIQERLADRLGTYLLAGERAFHSPLIETAAASLRSAIPQSAVRPNTIPWIRNTDGQVVPVGTVVDAGYFASAALSPVRFEAVLASAKSFLSEAIALEIGPGKALSGFAEAAGLPAVPLLPSVVGPSPARSVLQALGTLWQAGQPIDLTTLSPVGQHLSLPTYPFYGPKWPSPSPGRSAARDSSQSPKAHASSMPTKEPVSRPILTEDAPTAMQIVRELWLEQLGVEDTNDQDDFFSLGGDSLTVARLARSMGMRLGVEVSVRALLKARTPAAQADLVEELLVEQILSEAKK